MKKVGIMGGTFNPIHIGHLIMAQEVYDKFKMDKILFIPDSDPPHKNKGVADTKDRFNMVKTAISGNSAFEISDIETKREGKTYTYDTLIQLKEMYEDVEFYFIIGFDTLVTLNTWRNSKDVFKLCKFVVANRMNNLEDMEREIRKKEELYNADIYSVNIPDVNISSTEIRRRVRYGETIKYIVPDGVRKYIMENGLYKG